MIAISMHPPSRANWGFMYHFLLRNIDIARSGFLVSSPIECRLRFFVFSNWLVEKCGWKLVDTEWDDSAAARCPSTETTKDGAEAWKEASEFEVFTSIESILKGVKTRVVWTWNSGLMYQTARNAQVVSPLVLLVLPFLKIRIGEQDESLPKIISLEKEKNAG